MSIAALIAIAAVAALLLAMCAAVGIIIVVLVLRRERRQEQRSSREVDKINALAAAGKITPDEAAQLRQAVLPYALSPVAVRPDQHLVASAILNIAYGALKIVGVLVAAGVFVTLGAGLHTRMKFEAQAGAVFMLVAIVVPVSMLVVTLGLALLRILAGMALRKQRGWARTTLIVLSVLSMLSFPLGTALAGYTLWVLLIREGAAAAFTPAANATGDRPY